MRVGLRQNSVGSSPRSEDRFWGSVAGCLAMAKTTAWDHAARVRSDELPMKAFGLGPPETA